MNSSPQSLRLGKLQVTATATTTSQPSTSLYQVLGVPTNASTQEIKAAYRKLALHYNPDVVAAGEKEMSADKFMRVHAAYSTLSDPQKRADYDRTIFLPPRRRVYSGYTSGNWETDQCW